MDLKLPEMPSKVNFGHLKWPIDLKWSEMRSNVIFGHPKWPPKKNLYRSEMALIAIEREFQTSKMADRSEMPSKVIFEHPMAILSKKLISHIQMADGSHFVKNFQKKIKLRINLKWAEMRSKVNFGHFQKKLSCVSI